MAVHVVEPIIGFGNVLIKLADFYRKAPQGRVDENLKDYERGRAFNFNVKFTKGELSTIAGDIYCNDEEFNYLSSVLHKLMSPTQELNDLYNAKLQSLENVDVGIHIRCGASMSDSKSMSFPDDYFSSHQTIKSFHDIVAQCKNRVFLASDSNEVKRMYKNDFGDKVVVFDTSITLSCISPNCGGAIPSQHGLMETYLEWLTLSKCPVVFTTCGPGFDPITYKGAGMSTFGYTAAAYGRSQLYSVFYNGQIVQLNRYE